MNLTSTNEKKGLTAALSSYFFWGFFPIYWKLLHSVEPLEVLAHRMTWSFVFYFLLMQLYFKQGLKPLFQQSLRNWLQSFFAAALMAINWGIYIYAVHHGQILEGSLAYFINPLMNVVIGVAFFNEAFPKSLKFAVLFAAAGVFWKILSADHFPTVALALATTFCLYGIVKKKMKIDPSLSSVMEGATLFVPAVIAAIYWRQESTQVISSIDWTLLVFSGLVTGLPLFLFSFAAQRVPYSLLGMLQFIAPSLQFLVGYFIYGESVSLSSWIAFALIWTGTGFYLGNRIKNRQFAK